MSNNECRSLSPKRDSTEYLWIQPEVNSQAESASLRSTLDRFRLWIFSAIIDLWPANPASFHFQKLEKNRQPSNYPRSLIRFCLNPFLLVEVAVVTYQCRITQSKVVHQYGGGPMRDVTWKRSIRIYNFFSEWLKDILIFNSIKKWKINIS